MDTLHAFFATPAGYAIYATLAACVVAFVSGVSSAVRDGTFTWQAIDAFVRADLLGRVVPIFIFLFGGFALSGDAVAGAALTAAGVAAAAAYVTTTVAAVLAKWTQGQKQGVPEE